jgi:hypothetical protein
MSRLHVSALIIRHAKCISTKDVHPVESNVLSYITLHAWSSLHGMQTEYCLRCNTFDHKVHFWHRSVFRNSLVNFTNVAKMYLS